MSKRIQLTQGKVALVDNSDFQRINQHKWFAKGLRRKDRIDWYAEREVVINGRWHHIMMQNDVLCVPSGQIDHKDGNGLNNRRSNLRPATSRQNGANRRKQLHCSSRYKGVYWNVKWCKWRAHIKVNYKPHHLGGFDSEVAAARAYNVAAIQYFGEFAKLNPV